MTTYKIVRFYRDPDISNKIIQRGLTIEEAQAHCNDPETSSQTCKNKAGKARTKRCGDWFEGFMKEK